MADAGWATRPPTRTPRLIGCDVALSFKSHKILLAPPLTRTLPIKHARTLAVALTKHSPLARGANTQIAVRRTARHCARHDGTPQRSATLHTYLSPPAHITRRGRHSRFKSPTCRRMNSHMPSLSSLSSSLSRLHGGRGRSQPCTTRVASTTQNRLCLKTERGVQIKTLQPEIISHCTPPCYRRILVSSRLTEASSSRGESAAALILRGRRRCSRRRCCLGTAPCSLGYNGRATGPPPPPRASCILRPPPAGANARRHAARPRRHRTARKDERASKSQRAKSGAKRCAEWLGW